MSFRNNFYVKHYYRQINNIFSDITIEGITGEKN